MDLGNTFLVDRLKYLYTTKGIDINTRGWALPVAKSFFDMGIFDYDNFAVHHNSNVTPGDDTKIHAHSNVKKALQNHVNGSVNPGIDYIRAYCDFFGCSSDYLLGFIDTPLHTKYDDIPLKFETIQALQEIRKNYLKQGAVSFYSYVNGIPKNPRQTLDTLNFLLSNPNFESILYKLEDYLNPQYSIPMFFMDATQSSDGKAHYHIPHNPIHETPKRDDKGDIVLDSNNMPVYDRCLPLVKDVTMPSDYRKIDIDNDFLEGVALREIEKYIGNIKRDYELYKR